MHPLHFTHPSKPKTPEPVSSSDRVLLSPTPVLLSEVFLARMLIDNWDDKKHPDRVQ